MYSLLKQKIGSSANDLNIFNEDYDNNISPNLKVTLYASFREVDDIIGFDIIQKLAHFNTELKDKNFTAKIKVS